MCVVVQLLSNREPESIADGDEGSATMEPLPVRMAFPGGVKPAPRNWVRDGLWSMLPHKQGGRR